MSSGLGRLLPDTRPLRIPAFRRLFVAGIVTALGAQMSAVAVQQQIFDLTGSSAMVGVASAVALMPLIVFGLAGGAIADTYDRRTVLLVTSVGIAVTSIGLWLCAFLPGEPVVLVMALLAVQQGLFAVNHPTRSAVTPRLVPLDQVPSANALVMTVTSVAVIVGPVLAGVLIPLIGLPWLYFVDALTLTAALYAQVRLPRMPPLTARTERATVTEGLRYLWLRPLLLMTFVIDIIAMVFGMPRVLFPQMAEQTFGGPPGGGYQLGLLNAGLAIGALLGGLTSGWIHRVHRQGVAIVAAIVLWGFAMIGFGLAAPLWLAVLFLALGGGADLISAVYRSSLVQVEATDEMRGRMQGVFVVVVAGGPRVADLLHGIAADLSSTAAAVIGGGVICVVLTVIVGRMSTTLWGYDSRHGSG